MVDITMLMAALGELAAVWMSVSLWLNYATHVVVEQAKLRRSQWAELGFGGAVEVGGYSLLTRRGLVHGW